jgi:hypothetical protein
VLLTVFCSRRAHTNPRTWTRTIPMMKLPQRGAATRRHRVRSTAVACC